MKETIEIKGRLYDSRQTLRERFGVSVTTLERWKAVGVLPMPLRIGRCDYYCRDEIEDRLTAQVGH